MNKHASLIGATGSTGKELLELLLKDEEFTRVDVFVRRDINLNHKKLNTHIIDFEKPEQWKHLVKGDVLFSCLGTTLKVAGSKKKQWKVDYDYQYKFAQIAKENNISSYVLVSAAYGSTDSKFFYSRMKGQLEEDVKALNFKKLIILKPSVLLRKDTDRTAEVLFVKTISLFNKIGLLKSNKPLPTSVLAKAMISCFGSLKDGEYCFEAKSIWEKGR